ncbi:HAD family hydrolase [Methylovirgula sp. 4M-Z18]|uniref:HAD family hydrolase n=1 Tax=Methylovirgula sp. 4M-Z18 TaxID=2293567 RepID=UPI000E2FF29D|nr:HAD family hydrolase [Methylovirgula sp. 4M-Z18]RFB78157.1 HAD family hydrolase [Methylovirgula sp. 4M-Z18]
MSLAAILFDKDGTLIDFHKTFGPAGERVIERLSADPAIQDRLAASLGYDRETQRFLPDAAFVAGTTDSFGPPLAAILGRDDLAQFFNELDGLFHQESLASIAPIGIPAEVIDALKTRGIRVGIATNDAEKSARAQAAALGLMAHIDFIAGYDSGHGGKPEPGMVLAFAEKFGVPPQQVGLVGDSLHDLHAARAAGGVAIAVLTGPASRDELAPHADYVLDNIGALPALIDSLAAR